ncbi:MAG: hypothetical protein IIW48_07805 [Clostridia bacterium]|nr:hypothetical protein [Clostridia bacterium]
MPKEIATWLSKQTSLFSNIKFLTEFPAIPKATPLRQTIVSVGLESVKISDFFTENNNGELVPAEYCRLADIKIRFSIYVPYSSGGTACHEAFTKIVDCLNFKSDLNLKESGCGAISADRDTDAFVMKSWVIVEAQFCPAESSAIQYESFMPKNFFCGTHINDSSIHVTQTEKDAWGKKPVMGTFFGTDENDQSIRLGFKPKFLIICIASYPPFWVESNGNSHCCAAVASEHYTSTGVSLTSTGFKVTQNSTTVEGTTKVELNRLGDEYSFIAFR